MYSLSYQDNDIGILKLRDRMCTGKAGVGLGQNIAGQLFIVNHTDHFGEKRLENDPFISTGALRSIVNTVKPAILTPSFPLEPKNGYFHA